MNDYILISLAAILLSLDFALNKLYQNKAGTSFTAGLLFNAVLGLLTTCVFFIINGFSFEFSVYSFIMASIMALLVLTYSIIGFRILKSGAVSEYALFLMAGGMIVPFIWGLIFLDEPVSVMRIIGISVILISIFLSKLGVNNLSASLTAMCAAIFVLNGFVSVISKLHQTQPTENAVSAAGFVLLSGAAKFIICGAALAVIQIKKRSLLILPDSVNPAAVIPIILASSVIGGVSYMLQLIGASALPASVIYPFVTGGSIIFSAVTDILFFKQRLSKRLIFSIMLCFAGTCLFL